MSRKKQQSQRWKRRWEQRLSNSEECQEGGCRYITGKGLTASTIKPAGLSGSKWDTGVREMKHEFLTAL